MDNQRQLRLEHTAAIKSVHLSEDKKILIIKGIASMYRTPEGFFQVDRDQELVNTDFMDLESYKKNPILVFQHDWKQPMGRIVSIENTGGALHITAEVHRLTGSEHIFEAVELGIIKSLSIGVVPHTHVYREFHEGDILEIASSTLVEISLTTVQSNQEALFEVVASKSPTIPASLLAKQNGMTDAELKEMLNKEKDVKMETIKKEVEVKESPATKEEAKLELTDDQKLKLEKEFTDGLIKKEADAKEADDKIKLHDFDTDAEMKAAKAEELKEELGEKKDKSFDEVDLVAAIVESNRITDELREEKELKIKEDKEKEETEAKEKADRRVTDAIEYIKERQEEIVNTPNDEFDTDLVEDFYEAVSNAAEAVEAKVTGIILEQASPNGEE